MAMIPPDVEFAVEDEAGRERIFKDSLQARAFALDLDDVARSAGQDPDELAAAFESPDPLARAWAYQTWAGHYGWRNFDDYPLVLDREEIEARYDLEL
jgi:hypothetical protein